MKMIKEWMCVVVVMGVGKIVMLKLLENIKIRYFLVYLIEFFVKLVIWF